MKPGGDDWEPAHPPAFYLPDDDFRQTRPLQVGRGEDHGGPSQEHVAAEREVGAVAHDMVEGPNGRLAIRVMRAKEPRLLINQAKAVTAWHGPAAVVLLAMDRAGEAHLVAAVDRRQCALVPADEWLAKLAGTLGENYACDGDRMLAYGAGGLAAGLPGALQLAGGHARRLLGFND